MNSVMNLTSMETYDIKTDQWTEIEYNVLSVTGATSHVIGEMSYSSSSSSSSLSSMETYDIKTDQWTEIEYNMLSVKNICWNKQSWPLQQIKNCHVMSSGLWKFPTRIDLAAKSFPVKNHLYPVPSTLGHKWPVPYFTVNFKVINFPTKSNLLITRQPYFPFIPTGDRMYIIGVFFSSFPIFSWP